MHEHFARPPPSSDESRAGKAQAVIIKAGDSNPKKSSQKTPATEGNLKEQLTDDRCESKATSTPETERNKQHSGQVRIRDYMNDTTQGINTLSPLFLVSVP